MRCLDDDPSLSWTFFFAHPDDELGIAGWINHLVKSGCRVHACWAHSTPIRMQESLVAMNLIGLDDDDCRFGDLPDGGFLSDMLSMDSWVHDVQEDTMADRYVTPAFEQGHLDHDALHYAVHRWTGHRHWELPMYWHYARVWQRIGEFADPTGEEVWPLDDETLGSEAGNDSGI